MKKYAALFSAITSFLIAPSVAFASQPLCPPGAFTNLCKLGPQNAGGIVGTVVDFIIIVGIIITLFFMVWGGVRWVMSGGDKAKIDQARGTITSAIIGLIIALLAFFILNIVLTFFTGKGLSTMQIPTLLQ